MKPIQPTTSEIPSVVAAEMQRLARINPLLSPTVGWPKLKGLQFVQSRLHLTHLTKADSALMDANPLWAMELNPKLRAETKRAFRGLLDEVVKTATDALKPAGWKLKLIDMSESNHVAMLWTRKGSEVAFLAYLNGCMPSISWINTKLSKKWLPSNNKPNAYSDTAIVVLAAQKGAREILDEACVILDKHMHTPRKDRPRDSALEVATTQHGVAQVHMCLGRESSLPSHHQKLVDSLRGQVCFVGFEGRRGRSLPEMKAHVIKNTPRTTFGAEEAWAEMSSELLVGSVRLVAVDDQGRMKWCETFGPNETVPKSTIKRLLASSNPWSPTADLEQRAIYRSLKQPE